MSCKLQLQQSLREISPAVCPHSVFTSWRIIEVLVYLFCSPFALWVVTTGLQSPAMIIPFFLGGLLSNPFHQGNAGHFWALLKALLGETGFNPLLPPKENVGAFWGMEMLLDWVLSPRILKGTASIMRCCPGTPSDSSYSVIAGIWLSREFSPLGFPTVLCPAVIAAGKADQQTKPEGQIRLRGPEAKERFPAFPFSHVFLGSSSCRGWMNQWVWKTNGMWKDLQNASCFASPPNHGFTHLGSTKHSQQMGLLSLLCVWCATGTFSTSAFAFCFWRDINGKSKTRGRKVQMIAAGLYFNI